MNKEKKDINGRIERSEALDLFIYSGLLELGKKADSVRRKLHTDEIVTFVVDRNINYTNICESGCSFCAFYRRKEDSDAYILTLDEICRKISELKNLGGTQLLMQGGLNPELKIEFFENLFREIKSRFPAIQNHSLSPAEVVCMALNSGITVDESLLRLKRAGLDSIPGGGAEILVDEVRKTISPKKIGWKQWREVMLKAARLEMPTTATMMFGSNEKPEDIVEHIFRIREMQDDGASFTAFIPWTYQPGNTELGGTTATGVDYLKVLALSRIILDNITNIQASWVTQGAKMAQTALFFGANDLGGTMLEENVVAAAGCTFRMSQQEMINLIQSAGFRAAQRSTTYSIIQEFTV
ncbi:MAG: dehypoxanthine futalosine cyclase [Desulfuromonadaceae bacterium]|nr:dehypoxanthine futalosine cyclase [Desulfuromonadaceae bacterium]MDD2854261.1 dehypoxanthine futalosine cyclase [Desulfuromonadaceae bacterium]